MTLALTCRLPDYIVLVADRRLTFRDGRIADESRNKGICFENRFVVAYSGLAHIGKLPTDVWISQALGNAEQRHPFDYITSAADNDVASLRLPAKDKRLAIIAVGWTDNEQHTDVLPTQYIISNAIAPPQGDWLPEAQGEFLCYETLLNRRGHEYSEWSLGTPVGVRPSDQVSRNFFRQFSRAVKHNVGPVEIARLLAKTIRAVAKDEKRVGNNLVVLIVPKPTAQPTNWMATSVAKAGMGKPDLKYPACYLLAESSFDFEWAMPNYVANGWVVTDISLGRDGEDFELKSCTRRIGLGVAGIGLKDAAGFEMRMELRRDAPTQVRIVRPGEPDRVLAKEGDRKYHGSEIFKKLERR